MDRLEAMAILLRVVETGSFSAASRDLRVPLATVSRKVNDLESHLGTRLLVRTTRKVALTEAGKTSTAVSIKPRLSVSTAEAAVWAAAQGVGATRVLHYQCADALLDGSLRIILADFEEAPLPIHLVHAGRGLLPSKMRVFLDFAASRLRDRLRSF